MSEEALQLEALMRLPLQILTFAALALSGSLAVAQTSDPPAAPSEPNSPSQMDPNGTANSNSSLPPGTAINAELEKSLDSKKVKNGDAVEAKTTQDVKEDGRVVLPRGTKLVGHVTEASARGKGDGSSTLAIQFDHAQVKGGEQLPLQVTLQAVAIASEAEPIGGQDLEGVGGTGVPNGTSNRGTLPNSSSPTPRATPNPNIGAEPDTSARGQNAPGNLTANSKGVYGLPGVTLQTNPANTSEGAMLSSSGKSVHLDGGTRLLLVTQAAASASR